MKQLIFILFSIITFVHCNYTAKETPISENSQNHRATPPSKYEITEFLENKKVKSIQNNDVSEDSIVPTDPTADYFVINIKGAKVYNQPNFDTKIISTLENGKGIQQKNLQQLDDDQLKINEGVTLEGHWLMINEPVQGYIFSSDFSTIRPIVTHYLINTISLLGEQIGEIVYKDTVTKCSNFQLETQIETTTYNNAVYKYIQMDGCFDHYYYFKNLKFHEIYHQTINEYSDIYSKLDNVPSFREVIDNQIIFDGTDATVDLILYKNPNGQYETYSYDCT
jgi:hypothetical protein